MKKYLFVLSVAMALMLGGCVTGKVAQNPAGKLTTLPYESAVDPNIFYNYNNAFEPQYVINPDGDEGVIYYLYNPNPNGVADKVVLIMALDGELLIYGYEHNGEEFIYKLNEEKTRYVRYIPEPVEEKSGGI